MRPLFGLFKAVGFVAVLLGFLVVDMFGAFLITHYFIDGSEPENPGTDLGAPIFFMLLALVGSPFAIAFGSVIGWKLLFGGRHQIKGGDRLKVAS